MVEKPVNTEAKAGLQPPPGTREINARCSKRYRSSVKKDKDNAYQEHRDEASNKDKDTVKSHNSFSANQPQTQAFKKDKCGRREGHPATGVNAIKVAKKDKDKTKELSYVKCYTCKQKGHYANKYPKKSKN